MDSTRKFSSARKSPPRVSSPTYLSAEYEAVIQSLQEQVHTLRAKLAVAEDSLRRREDQRGKRYDGDWDAGARSWEKEVAKAREERNFWETKAHILEQKLAKSILAATDLEASKTYSRPPEREQTNDHSEELKETKAQNEELKAEVGRLREKMGQLEAIQNQQSWLQADLLELETQIDKKDELLKSANKRFQQAQKRLETLEKENSVLSKSVQSLEQDRRRLSEKWQSLAQRTKTEGGLRNRVTELEETVEKMKTAAREKDALIQDQQKRISALEIRLTSSESSLAHVTDSFRRTSLQAKLDVTEKQTLARMAETLSIQLHRAEEALQRCTSTQSDPRSLSPGPFQLEDRVSADTRRLTSQSLAVTSKLQQFASEGKLSPTEASLDLSQALGKSLATRSGLHTRSSTSISPAGERQAGRSKTPTPTKPGLSRLMSMGASPILAPVEHKPNYSPQSPLKELPPGIDSSYSPQAPARLKSSDRKNGGGK